MIATTAEDRIRDSRYIGECPRYNFEKHVSVHQKAHLDIAAGTDMALTDHDKVRRLLQTIEAPNMLVTTATIKAIDGLRLN